MHRAIVPVLGERVSGLLSISKDSTGTVDLEDYVKSCWEVMVTAAPVPE